MSIFNIIIGENVTFLSVHPFSVFLYSTRIKTKMAQKYSKYKNYPENSPFTGVQYKEQQWRNKVMLKRRQDITQLRFGRGCSWHFCPWIRGWKKIRWWTQIPWGSPPDGKALTQHWLFFCGDHAPIVAAHLMIVQPSRETIFPEHLIISFKLSLNLENRIKKVSTVGHIKAQASW